MNQQRVYAIDVLRALTLALMLFVNDIPGMENIPLWLQHMPKGADALGLADVVFPLFLFVVGMSIPLAIEHRRKKGDDTQKVLIHVFTRTFALIVIGMFRVNVPYLNSELTGIPQYLWAMLAYIAVFVLWNVYPKGEKTPNALIRVFKIMSIVGLVWLAFIYRSGTVGNEEYMQPRWWGILGQIGWCYLIGSLAYILIGKNILKLSILLLLVGFYHVLAMFWSADYMFLTILPGKGSLTLMALAGLLATIIFERYKGHFSRFLTINLVVGILFFVLCMVLRSVWGISKEDNSPTWIYICLAIGFAVFPLVYWLVDLKGIRRWTNPIEPGGTGTLTAYLLSDFCYYFTWYFGWGYPDWLNSGMVGILRSIVFVFFILYLVRGLRIVGFRLKL